MGSCSEPVNISLEFAYCVKLCFLGDRDGCADGNGLGLIVDDQKVSVEVPESSEVAAAGFVGLKIGHWLVACSGFGEALLSHAFKIIDRGAGA